MSGGHFDYIDSRAKNEIFGYGDKWWNVFEDREISELVWDIFDLIHEFDWYRSGDTSKLEYLNAKTNFKKKWFSNRGVRIRRTINDAIQDVKQELYETYNVNDVEGAI